MYERTWRTPLDCRNFSSRFEPQAYFTDKGHLNHMRGVTKFPWNLSLTFFFSLWSIIWPPFSFPWTWLIHLHHIPLYCRILYRIHVLNSYAPSTILTWNTYMWHLNPAVLYSRVFKFLGFFLAKTVLQFKRALHNLSIL
jgi:hypothetical protein